MSSYYAMARAEKRYLTEKLYGVPLLEWAVRWFQMSNDAFFEKYGFNFNPHDYPCLYTLARKKVYGE